MGIEGFTEESFYADARLQVNLRKRGEDDVIWRQSLPQNSLGRRIEAYIEEGVRLMKEFSAWASLGESSAELVRGMVSLNFVVMKRYILPEDKGAYADGRTEPTK